MRAFARFFFAAVTFNLGAGHAAAATVPCVSGFAGPYPCANVDLLARMPLTAVGASPTATGNDVWGWTDPVTGKEYAILGLSNAASFIDISDPIDPVYVGRLLAPSASGSCVPGLGPGATPLHDCSDPGPDEGLSRAPESCSGDSLWRDHEVYANYLFVGSEQLNHGLVVFDLTRLRGAAPGTEFTQDARYCGYGKSHTTTINTQTGFLYANGANQSTNVCGGSGGPIIVDIRNPTVPVFAGCDNADGYTHDSQCFVYQGPDVAHQGQSICIDSNGRTSPASSNRLVIKDVTNPAVPVRLSSTGYAGAGYTHQGWITADHRYFLLDDELDEENLGGNTRTYIWDLLDLEAPQLIGTHLGPTTAIDHQQFIYGSFSYQSNYRAGLRILETKDIAAGALTEVGKFDVYPPDDITDYGGTWANYPFYRSGVVALTTIGPPYGSLAGEFFVVRPLFADLALTVTDSPDPVVLGQNITYAFSVRNQGPTYATNVTLTDTLPASLTLISTAPPGACTGTTAVTCNLGTIQRDGIVGVTIVAQANVAGTVTNSGVASATEVDTRLADNTAAAQTSVNQAAQAAEAAALSVDAGGNRVFQANEGAVTVAPSWRNIGTAAITLSGSASSFTGPAGPTYTPVDVSGAYPTMNPGATTPCNDCYSFSIDAAARPAIHWDATFQEMVNPSATAKTWTLHVGDSFTDVPATSGFFRFVETILHKSVTTGCSPTTYCPLASTTREQMAAFALVSKEGAAYVPPACGSTPIFGDVPASSPFCRWVEELARRGVVGGCGGGNYCPSGAVTREQMAIFALKTLEGPTYTPPACGAPIFNDVPASSPFCRWIEELSRRSIVSGCGNGNYCPGAAVTREQMSVFLTVTFGLLLYGV